MKRWIAILFCIFLIFSLIACQDSSPATQDTMYRRLEKRCREVAATYRSAFETENLSDSSVLDAEECLLCAGLSVYITNEENWPYLPSGDSLISFLDGVTEDTAGEWEIFSVDDAGKLSLRLFSNENGEFRVYNMEYPLDGEPYYEVNVIQDWALTETGSFYYRVYAAGNKHYADYSRIRLNPSDPELFALTKQYVQAGGYVGTNLYLTNWSEDDWQDLHFNDIWEYLYQHTYGTAVPTENYAFAPETNQYQIPATEFETLLLSYFAIEPQTLRQLAHYDPETERYPWRQVETEDYLFLQFYTTDAAVTACQENPDGTLTLTVDVASADLKTDRLFSHMLTVRPLQNGTFQFVRNQLTYQIEYGLPFCTSRLTWD